MRALFAILFLLPACLIDPGDKIYHIDGVRVVVENRLGPSKANMKHATSIFREAAMEYWSLDEAGELEVWQSIEKIVWTIAPVEHGINFHPIDRVLYAHWTNCILDVEFYQGLSFVYDDDVQEADLDWAKALEDANRKEVCAHDTNTRITIFSP